MRGRILPTAPRRAAARLVAQGRAMAAAGLVGGSVGNLSERVGDQVVITPTRVPYGQLSERDVVAVDLHGQRLHGRREPSRELPLHLAVYRARPDVDAIVHCHSRWATAWSWLDAPLLPATEEIGYYDIGTVLTVPRAKAGSEGLAAMAAAALGAARAALLGGHGTIAVGADLAEAVAIAQAIEHQAHVAWLLRLDRATLTASGAALPAMARSPGPGSAR